MKEGERRGIKRIRRGKLEKIREYKEREERVMWKGEGKVEKKREKKRRTWRRKGKRGRERDRERRGGGNTSTLENGKL